MHMCKRLEALVHIRIFPPLITKYMFRYISALSFGRVPRDLIMEPRLVSCIARLQPHPSPTGNGGGRPSSFQPSFPFPLFFFFSLAF
jgi:hypothetical protein